MEKHHDALDTSGGRDVTMSSSLGLGGSWAHPKWDYPMVMSGPL